MNDERKIPIFHTLIVYCSDISVISALQKYLPIKIAQEKPYKFKTTKLEPTARELLAEIPQPKEGYATLIICEGKMYSDTNWAQKTDRPLGSFIPKSGYAIEGLAEKYNKKAIVSTVKGAIATRHTAIHETAHLLGLEHCKNKCFMIDGFLQRKKYTFEWCKDCSEVLKTKR